MLHVVDERALTLAPEMDGAYADRLLADPDFVYLAPVPAALGGGG